LRAWRRRIRVERRKEDEDEKSMERGLKGRKGYSELRTSV